MKMSRSLIRRVLSLLSAARLPDAGGPSEPPIPVREPRRHGPGGRSTAAALKEPAHDVSTSVEATGTVFQDR